jgi:hypothetical protein
MDEGQVRHQPQRVSIYLDYAEPCIEARRLVNAISDACKLKEWDRAFSLQQELDGAVMDIGEAIVAGMDRGNKSSI